MNFNFIIEWWSGVYTENLEKLKGTIKRNIISIAVSSIFVCIAFIVIVTIDLKQMDPGGNTAPIFFRCNDTTLIRDNSIFCNTNRTLFSSENFVQPTPEAKHE